MNPILERYVVIANMIATTVGNNCEVVLHDLEDPEHSVVQLQVGRFNQLVPAVMMSKKLETGLVTNYYFHSSEGKLIKSSTAFIKDDNKVIGAICINIDVSHIKAYINELEAQLPGLEDMNHRKSRRDVVDSNAHIGDIVTDLIDTILDGRDAAGMPRKEKMDIIKEMNERGVFLMKGAIDVVSEKMGIAKVTIYSYLDRMKDN